MQVGPSQEQNCFDPDLMAIDFRSKAKVPLYSASRACLWNRAITMNAAGSTCNAHTSMGKCQGLCHRSLLDLVCWVYERLFLDDDCFFHECGLFCPEWLVNDIACSKDRYAAMSIVFGGDVLGFPYLRRRLWQGYANQKRWVLTTTADNLFPLVAKTIVANGDIYFDGTERCPLV